MSILETFYILFKSDTSGLKKGTKEAKDTTDDLNNSLKSTADAGDKIGETFFSVANSFAKMAAAAISVYAVIDGLKKANDYTAGLEVAARQMNVNVQDLDAWGNALRKTGGDAQSFIAMIRGISQHTGLSFADSIKILPVYADALKKLGQVQAFRVGPMFGLDAAGIAFLRQGSEEVNKAIQHQKELGTISENAAENLDEYNQAWMDTQHVFRSLAIEIDGQLAPALTKVLHALNPAIEYLQTHTPVAVGLFVTLAAVATALLSPLLAVNLELLGIALAIGAVTVAFAFLYEEVVAFTNGQNSFLTDVGNRWPVVGKIISFVINSNIESFKILAAIGKQAFSGITATARYLRWEVELLLNGLQKVYEFFGGDKSLNGKVTLAQGQLQTATSSALAAQTSNSIFNSSPRVNNTTIVHNGDVKIETQSSDPQGILNTVRDWFTRHHWGAISGFDNGVAK